MPFRGLIFRGPPDFETGKNRVSKEDLTGCLQNICELSIVICEFGCVSLAHDLELR